MVRILAAAKPQAEGGEPRQGRERQGRDEPGLLGRPEIEDHSAAEAERDEEGEVERRSLAPEELPQALRHGMGDVAQAPAAQPIGRKRRAPPAENGRKRADGL
jgi:hypothetical protein